VQIVVFANHQKGVKIFTPGTERSSNASWGFEGPGLDEEQGGYFPFDEGRVM
jgi:hypothetical protein